MPSAVLSFLMSLASCECGWPLVLCSKLRKGSALCDRLWGCAGCTVLCQTAARCPASQPVQFLVVKEPRVERAPSSWLSKARGLWPLLSSSAACLLRNICCSTMKVLFIGKLLVVLNWEGKALLSSLALVLWSATF